MPFYAKTSQGEIVHIGDYTNPHQQLAGENLLCRLCGHGMHVRAGVTRRPHFAHDPGEREDCLYSLEREYQNESDEHIEGKRTVADYLSRQALYEGAVIEFEKPFLDVGRIGDVVVTFPSGSIEVHEVQLCSTNPREIHERTKDYQQVGADVIWWLGLEAASDANQEFSKNTYGYLALLDFYWRKGGAS